MHLDIWVDGINLLRDAGSYKYNSTPEDIKYFMGTSSHNTVQLGDFDQMEKGGRFIWYNWSTADYASVYEDDMNLLFEGEISAYKHISKGIKHNRKVKKSKGELYWEIEDIIKNSELEATQIWNIHPKFNELGYKITSVDKNGNYIPSEIRKGFFSSFYGVKEDSEQIIFKSSSNYFKTTISKNKL